MQAKAPTDQASPIPTPTSPHSPPATQHLQKRQDPTMTARQRLSILPTTSTLRDVRRRPTSVTSTLYISEIKTDGFAILVSDCHHVLEWPIALLPSDCKKGEMLEFNLAKSAAFVTESNNKMDTIQQVLKEAATAAK
jgi:hypothetical protein